MANSQFANRAIPGWILNLRFQIRDARARELTPRRAVGTLQRMSWHFEESVNEVAKMIESGATEKQVQVFLNTVLPADRERVLAEARKRAKTPDPAEDHEGGTERQVGDTAGPGAGYDVDPAQVKDKGGVS
jgi:hypothetical protein